MVWASLERGQEVVVSTNGLLSPQLFGDVCYNCSHVIEGDGEASVPKPLSLPCFLPTNLFCWWREGQGMWCGVEWEWGRVGWGVVCWGLVGGLSHSCRSIWL